METIVFMKKLRGIVLLGLAFLFYGASWGTQHQFFNEIHENLVFFEGLLEPPTARPGEQVQAIISANIKHGWHIYSVVASKDEFAPPPTFIKWEPFLIVQGEVYETNPIIDHDPVIGMVLSYHEGIPRLFQNFQIPQKIEPGLYQVQGVVQYQACSDKVCLPPTKTKISIPFQVESGPIRPAYASKL